MTASAGPLKSLLTEQGHHLVAPVATDWNPRCAPAPRPSPEPAS
jgi:hypothetical protein